IHASSSRGMVAQSAFTGKTIPNGGWNRVGLASWVDYGLSETQQTALAAASDDSAGNAEDSMSAVEIDTSSFFTVKKGCKGGAVRRMQTWLTDLGYDLGVCGTDGDFGPATDAAVRAFQQTNSLTTDGVVGQKTWGMLAKVRQAAAEEAQA
ncbi:MAG: peptidoglycan-binding protein, partial [Eubacteriales bacterium]|nr:peptidoglycan-binding protein [Eubacteriales bacterium]